MCLGIRIGVRVDHDRRRGGVPESLRRPVRRGRRVFDEHDRRNVHRLHAATGQRRIDELEFAQRERVDERYHGLHDEHNRVYRAGVFSGVCRRRRFGDQSSDHDSDTVKEIPRHRERGWCRGGSLPFRISLANFVKALWQKRGSFRRRMI